jgi:hypothetical protein
MGGFVRASHSALHPIASELLRCGNRGSRPNATAEIRADQFLSVGSIATASACQSLYSCDEESQDHSGNSMGITARALRSRALF